MELLILIMFIEHISDRLGTALLLSPSMLKLAHSIPSPADTTAPQMIIFKRSSLLPSTWDLTGINVT